MTEQIKPAKQIAAGLILYNGKVLIAQRKRGKDLALYWELPGGKLEQGETLEQCLKRELLEEMALPIEVDKFFMQSVYDYQFGTFAINAFLAHSATDNIPMLSAHEQYKWIKPKEMVNYKFPPADIPIIENFIKTYPDL